LSCTYLAHHELESIFIVVVVIILIIIIIIIIMMQGDVLCAEALNQILVTRDGQSRLLAAFIHRVVPLHQTVSTLRTPRSNKLSWLATWRDRNIFLHRTHVGMAVQVWYTHPFVTRCIKYVMQMPCGTVWTQVMS